MGLVSTIAELRSDPERLLSCSAGQHELELALLGSLRSIAVPPGAKSLVWHALGVQVIGTGVSAAVTSSSWASAFWRGALKVLVTSKAAVAVPIVVAALGASALHYRDAVPASVARVAANATIARPASAVSAPARVESLEAPEPATAESEDSASAEPPSRAAVFAPRDHLREESALLERARALLRSGHPRAAQATLVRLQAQFPKGSLTQEREVLLIEALAARGDAGAAARDARSFVAAHPESPHARQLRRFLDHGVEPDARPN